MVVCPPKQPKGSASFWLRAVAHDREKSVITFLFLFLTCILSFQVHGADAFEQIQGLLGEISDSPKADHIVSDKTAGDGREGDEGSRKDSHDDSGQWHGFFFEDVSWWLG